MTGFDWREPTPADLEAAPELHPDAPEPAGRLVCERETVFRRLRGQVEGTREPVRLWLYWWGNGRAPSGEPGSGPGAGLVVGGGEPFSAAVAVSAPNASAARYPTIPEVHAAVGRLPLDGVIMEAPPFVVGAGLAGGGAPYRVVPLRQRGAVGGSPAARILSLSDTGRLH